MPVLSPPQMTSRLNNEKTHNGKITVGENSKKPILYGLMTTLTIGAIITTVKLLIFRPYWLYRNQTYFRIKL